MAGFKVNGDEKYCVKCGSCAAMWPAKETNVSTKRNANFLMDEILLTD
jgi:hypothetical protein